VWQRIAAAGTRAHPAYGHGMTRSIHRTNGRHALTALDHPDARRRGWPDAEFCDLCDLVLTGPARLRPSCDHCADPGCTASLEDGQGFDGYCGECADRRDPPLRLTRSPPAGRSLRIVQVAPAPAQPPGRRRARPPAGPRSAHTAPRHTPKTVAYSPPVL